MLFTKEVNNQILKENNRKYFLIINDYFVYKRDNKDGIDDNGYELISKYYKISKSNKDGESLHNRIKYYKEILFKYIINHKVDVHSARIWYAYPAESNDPWIGAKRVNSDE